MSDAPPMQRAVRDAQHIERHLGDQPAQLVLATDDLDYAWTVAVAFLARRETSGADGCCVVSTVRSAGEITRRIETQLSDTRLGVVQIGLEESDASDPYAATPVYSLPTVGDYTSLFLTIESVVDRFDGESTLLVHSLEELLAETSVNTVSRLLSLCGDRLTATPQLFTLDSSACSSETLQTIRRTVDTVVHLDQSSGGRGLSVE